MESPGLTKGKLCLDSLQVGISIYSAEGSQTSAMDRNNWGPEHPHLATAPEGRSQGPPDHHRDLGTCSEGHVWKHSQGCPEIAGTGRPHPCLEQAWTALGSKQQQVHNEEKTYLGCGVPQPPMASCNSSHHSGGQYQLGMFWMVAAIMPYHGSFLKYSIWWSQLIR